MSTIALLITVLLGTVQEMKRREKPTKRWTDEAAVWSMNTSKDRTRKLSSNEDRGPTDHVTN